MKLATINQALACLEKQSVAGGEDMDAAALKRLDEMALMATPRTPDEAQAQARYLIEMARGGSLVSGGTRIVDAFQRIWTANARGYENGMAA